MKQRERYRTAQSAGAAGDKSYFATEFAGHERLRNGSSLSLLILIEVFLNQYHSGLVFFLPNR
jgi:hypothetical protein